MCTSGKLTSWLVVAIVVVGFAASGHSAGPQASGASLIASAQATPDSSEAATKLRVQAAYGKLPLRFEANRGQTDERVKFLSRGDGHTLFLTSTEAVLSLYKRRKPLDTGSGPRASVKGFETQGSQLEAVLRMQLVAANPHPQVEGLEELPGKSHYFLGSDSRKWRTQIPTYGKVRYRNVYPGVDLVHYGNQRQLEHDFIVHPGADPKAITLAFNTPLGIDATGDLVLTTAAGEVRLRKPHIYQEIDGLKQPIAGSYVLLEANTGDPALDARHVGFQVAAYDISKPLVIDPVLAYSTYLGGSGFDSVSGIAVDSSGNVYVSGSTASADFPNANTSPIQPALGGGSDAFVAKLNAAGSRLEYSTYLGGTSGDSATGIAIDAAGNAYVTGLTSSVDFPLMNPLPQSFVCFPLPCSPGVNIGASGDAFVAKVSADGAVLEYSTYLGGGNLDVGLDIAADAAGIAYVTGYTYSANFPLENALQPSIGGGVLCPNFPIPIADAFVVKLDPSAVPADQIVYSSFLGGSCFDTGNAIAVDPLGHAAYVTGQACSLGFPTEKPLPHSFSGINVGAGPCDAFVTIVDHAGALVYSTYLGGAKWDIGTDIAVDVHGDVYVTGQTASTFPLNFPTKTPVQPSHGGGQYDAFVAKMTLLQTSMALVYSTYLGGTGDDMGLGIAVDADSNAYVTGYTTDSTYFPPTSKVTLGPGGKADAFVATLRQTGPPLPPLLSSTVLGGSDDDGGGAIAVDTFGYVYVAGSTLSSDFPTRSAMTSLAAGGPDAFIAKMMEDRDGDGISDLVDGYVDPIMVFHPEFAFFSNKFTDEHLGGKSFGSIVDRGGLNVTVEEAANPGGLFVRATVGATGGTGPATVNACDFELKFLGDGGDVEIVCGSLTLRVYRGTIKILLDGFGTLTVPAGVTATVTRMAGEGEYTVQNLEGSAPLVVEFQGQVSNVQPGASLTVKAVAGKIVANNDEWTLSDEAETLQGHPFFPDAHNFALNIATWFTEGRPGNFLVYSSNFGLTGSKLAAAMTGAGHSWTVDPGLPFTLSTLQQFDAVFLALPPSVDNQVLIDYVKGGGNVYVAAGTAWGGSAQGEADLWNRFLNAFGLRFEPYFNNDFIPAPPPCSAPYFSVTSSHPILNGVSTLVFCNGNSVSRLSSTDPNTAILESFDFGLGLGPEGLIAVFAARTALIQELISDVKALNLEAGMERRLVSILERVVAALGIDPPPFGPGPPDPLGPKAGFDPSPWQVAAVNQLRAFINAIEAQRGKRIAQADADALIAAAKSIVAALTMQ